MSDAIMSLEGVTVRYPVRSGPFGRVTGHTPVLDRVDIDLREGEVLGLLGESGSGKSTLGRVMLGLLAPDAGVVRYRGEPLAGMSPAARATFRRKAQLIFQDPLSALNPEMSVEQIVTEPLRIQGMLRRPAIRETAMSLLTNVSLDPDLVSRRPSQLSGGQRQRLVIARALSVRPDLVVADEPVSALDVSVQAQILDLLSVLRRTMQLTMLFISHDIAVVRYIADRIAVMYRGAIVEIAPAAELIANPRHPYTRTLLESSPDFRGAAFHGEGPGTASPRAAGPGGSTGCVFEHRCSHAISDCRSAPRLREIAPGHSCACVLEG
jgi:oligopeptide/dipeptide ABC transporter ATP-binding protein